MGQMLICLSSGHKALCVNIKMTQHIQIKKNLSKQIINIEHLGTKNSRQLRGRGFPPPRTKNLNSEDPSGSIRDITAHLIHDKNTSIALSCTVFNFPSAGNDLGWIYWSYEFYFFDPGDFRPGGRHRPDPDVKIWRSKCLTPSYYVVVYGDFEKRN